MHAEERRFGADEIGRDGMQRLGRSTAANLVPPGSLPRKQEGGFEDRQIAPAQKVGARSTGEPGFLNQTKGAALKAVGQRQLRKLQTSLQVGNLDPLRQRRQAALKAVG